MVYQFTLGHLYFGIPVSPSVFFRLPAWPRNEAGNHESRNLHPQRLQKKLDGDVDTCGHMWTHVDTCGHVCPQKPWLGNATRKSTVYSRSGRNRVGALLRGSSESTLNCCRSPATSCLGHSHSSIQDTFLHPAGEGHGGSRRFPRTGWRRETEETVWGPGRRHRHRGGSMWVVRHDMSTSTGALCNHSCLWLWSFENARNSRSKTEPNYEFCPFFPTARSVL